MKCLVIYQSKSGYTKRYMQMLTESVEADSFELKTANPKNWRDYETIVFAGGIYAGKISGINKFIKMLGNQIPKKLVIVGVGAAPVTDLVKKKLIQENLTNEYFLHTDTNKPEFFYLQGGFDPEKLNFALKSMLGLVSKNLVKKQIKSPDSLTEDDRAFLNFFQKANDQTSADQLTPIIAYLKR